MNAASAAIPRSATGFPRGRSRLTSSLILYLFLLIALLRPSCASALEALHPPRSIELGWQEQPSPAEAPSELLGGPRRYRFYDPSIGRFMSPDPIKDGVNHYLYADGDPVNKSDPLGLYWIWNGQLNKWEYRPDREDPPGEAGRRPAAGIGLLFTNEGQLVYSLGGRIQLKPPTAAARAMHAMDLVTHTVSPDRGYTEDDIAALFLVPILGTGAAAGLTAGAVFVAPAAPAVLGTGAKVMTAKTLTTASVVTSQVAMHGPRVLRAGRQAADRVNIAIVRGQQAVNAALDRTFGLEPALEFYGANPRALTMMAGRVQSTAAQSYGVRWADRIRAYFRSGGGGSGRSSADLLGSNVALGRFKSVTTPWQRRVWQRADIDWDFVRPQGVAMAGKTNLEAAMRGYSPVRINPATGKVDDVVLHHALDDPRAGAIETWRSSHSRFHQKIGRDANDFNEFKGQNESWRRLRPEWAQAWTREQSAYWRWRTGQYNPPPTSGLTLPGD